MNAIIRFDVQAGYSDAWQAGRSAQQIREMKADARRQIGSRFGWINAAAWDGAAHEAARRALELEANSREYIPDAQLVNCADALLASKQHQGDPVVKTGASLTQGGCRPSPDPPPFAWSNIKTFELLDGAGAAVVLTVEDSNQVQAQVPLVLFLTWDIEYG